MEDKLLVVEFWRSSSRERTPSSKQLGTVKSISYCNRKSFVAYNALVAIAIEQIQRGITPQSFEKEGILTTDVELASIIVNEEYEILGVRRVPMGGAEVLVGFKPSKAIVGFWIYPLQWRYPVIRDIYKIQGASIPISESA
jgi:hypothetical protein